jgi:hypothetical protein
VDNQITKNLFGIAEENLRQKKRELSFATPSLLCELFIGIAGESPRLRELSFAAPNSKNKTPRQPAGSFSIPRILLQGKKERV